MFYVDQDLNCTQLKTYSFSQGIAVLLLELNLTKRKWFIIGLYKAPSLQEELFISQINKALTFYTNSFDNILQMGDFNMKLENQQL